MKIPKYEEIRKPAPLGYRPAIEAKVSVAMIFEALTRGIANVGVVEAFDLMTQERVAVLALVMDEPDDSEHERSITPFAILHNGVIAERLLPCCGLVKGENGEDNGVTPEEWDMLPCFVKSEGKN